jgi:hypothetical protein
MIQIKSPFSYGVSLAEEQLEGMRGTEVEDENGKDEEEEGEVDDEDEP